VDNKLTHETALSPEQSRPSKISFGREVVVTVAVTAGAEFLAAQALQAGVAVVALLKLIILAVGPLPGWLAVEGVPLLGWRTTEDAHPHIRVVARLPPGAAAVVMEAEACMPVAGLLRKLIPLPSQIQIDPNDDSWNPSSRTPYISDSERSAWDAGSKTPGRAPLDDSWGSMDGNPSSTARTPGAYNAASPDFSYGSKEFSAPTPGNPLSAPTPSAPTPGPISAPTPAAWGADTAPTPGASGGYGRSSAFPSTPGAWEE
jgi:hypothetical protein